MAKKNKLSTPAWILEGYDSPAEYNKAKGIKEEKKPAKKTKKKSGKGFKIKICPKCKSENVGVVIGGEEGKGSKGWECQKCKWKGMEVGEKEVSEDEFLKSLEKK